MSTKSTAEVQVTALPERYGRRQWVVTGPACNTYRVRGVRKSSPALVWQSDTAHQALVELNSDDAALALAASFAQSGHVYCRTCGSFKTAPHDTH